MKRLTLLAVALLAAPFAGAAYKCVNEKGITLIGDTPPDGCEHVEMYEVTPTGKVLRKIDPTPSPEQVKAYAADADRRRAAERAAAEQKRKDTALLNTYSSDKEIDTARDRNTEPMRGRIASAKQRIVEVDKRLKQIDDEMEFYKAGKSKKKDTKAAGPPPGLLADRERVKKERETLVATIAASEKEIVAVRERYEGDKVRFNELKGNPAPKPGSDDGKVAQGPAPTAGKAKCGDLVHECQVGQPYICRVGSKRYPADCVAEGK